jgi:hypothetical protein
MKYNFFLILVLLISLSSEFYPQQTYFIKYKNNVDLPTVAKNISQNKISDALISQPLNLPDYSMSFFAKGLAKNDQVLGRIVTLNFSRDIDEDLFFSILSNDDNIEYFQPSSVYKIDFIPNDSLLDQQWGLEKINAFDAWEITTGSDSILIGVIDTGIDYLHPDLNDRIYFNSGETGTDNLGRDKRSNNVDDDNNGFVDDYQGWDFTDRVGFPFDSSGGDYLNWDNDPKDENGHGTYITGIATASTNNITGIAGTGPNLKVLNLRAFDPAGYGEEDDVAAAILYAVQIGAKVLNMSFGDDAFSLVLRDVIQYAYSRNVIMIGSAGNSGSDAPHYPSGYSEVICVGNSTIQDFVASNSNFGSTIDLVAPGSLIMTTAMDNNYAIISGTSASAPFVSAAAGLILSLGNFSNEEVKQILKSTTDDIDSPGWDLRSGAGRLNLFRAVSVTAPSIIEFNFPKMDFTTKESNLPITATVLSPFFQSYSLYYGIGYNPENWTVLVDNGLNQFSKTEIYNLNISNFPDTVYSLRIEVNLTNGRTLEERINFYIIRTAPKIELISIGSSFYGDKATVLGAVYTDQPSIVRMFYRQFGTSDYSYITLDGFTTNNQFVKNMHYGFIPKQLVQQNTLYEVYFEAENLVGLKKELRDQNNNPFIVNAEYNHNYAAQFELPYSLPPGNIFEKPVSFLDDDFSEVVLRELFNPKTSMIYKYVNNSLVKVDSLFERIFKDFGDFNNNGKKDLLAFFVYDGYLLEQSVPNSTNLNQTYSNTTGKFWPILAKDIDNDQITEVIVVDGDSSIAVWNVTQSLSVADSTRLPNFTQRGLGFNLIDSPNATIADLDKDGKNEIWMVDDFGDIYSYEVSTQNKFTKGTVITTTFSSSAAYLSSGDYDGDGITELAVLLHSIEPLDIAPFYKLLIFNLKNDNLNIILDQNFIDAASEFRSASAFQQADNSVKFEDLDNDQKDELILFMFPYSYIFKYEPGSSSIISYKENINSNSIFVGDLNNNGVKEIAFPTSEGIKFFEFTISNIATTPYNLSGYSLDTNLVRLTWSSKGDQFNIYRGESKDNLSLYDSTFSPEYFDGGVINNKFYYYAIQAVDYSKPNPFSDLSQIIEIYSHKPGKFISAESFSYNSVIISFSEKVNNTIENLQSFNVIGVGNPVSVSPANQFSYLLSFGKPLPEGNNKVFINGLKDLYGSPIASDTLEFLVSPVVIQKEFFIESFEIINQFRIKISFNLEPDENSIKILTNYEFEPDNSVINASLDPANKRILFLDINNSKPVGSIGKEYKLHIKNIVSSSQSGSIMINAGAGSFIVLSSFASDLSDVYVYPNPFRAENGVDKITFANLPQRARITIWSLSGVQIYQIDEINGDGGVDYFLTNREGEKIGSGIYIYRIVMLDEFNNELEEKLGKFAVIR